ncbi:MAG: hypothetical protein ACO1OB_16150 [Archangium sp.]
MYRFGAVPQTWEQRALLPQLLRPARAALSHWTAGWVHRLAGIRRPSRLDVTIGYDTKLALDGVDLHYAKWVRTDQRVGGFVVMPIGRTIVDLASVMRREPFTFAFDSATAKYPREMDSLFRYVSTRPLRGHSGLATLRGVFAERHGVMLESPLESRVWTALVRSKLPVPKAQHPVGEVMRVDFLWWNERVALHVDSRAFHSSRAEIERDARQRNRLADEWASFVVTHGTVSSKEWLEQIRIALDKRSPQLRLAV